MAKLPEAIPQLREIAARAGVTVPWERITVNRWSPDTCGCVVEQWFDDDEPDPKTVLFARVVSVGAEHDAGASDEPLWNACRGENFRKNRAANVIANIKGITVQDATNEMAWTFGTGRLADGIERQLTVSASLTVQQANQLGSLLDTQFGAGAISVQRV